MNANEKIFLRNDFIYKMANIAQIVAFLIFMIFIMITTYLFIGALSSWDHSLPHIWGVSLFYSSILPAWGWTALMWTLEIVIFFSSCIILFYRKKIWLSMLAVIAIVDFVFLYLISVFIIRYSSLFACL